MSPGITKPNRSRAWAAMNAGSASFAFCCSRSAICARSTASDAASCLISVRCAKYVRTGPAMVSVSTHTTAARIAARRAADPNRCSDRCSAAAAIDALIDSVMGSCSARGSAWRGSRRCGARGRPRPESPGLPGREAGERRLDSDRFPSGTCYLVSF